MSLFPDSRPLGRTRLAGLLLALLLALQLAAVWYRTPGVPAASSGDEVWFSESGLFLQEEGRLRRPMLADDRGSALKDLYPPVIGVGQAIGIRLFGLNDFGIMALSSINATLCVGLVLLVLRRRGASLPLALLAACAVLGPMTIQRDLLCVRPESCIPALMLLVLLLLEERKERPWPAGFLLAGLATGLACLCYYPNSPSILLGAVALVFPLTRKSIPAFLWFLAGGLIALGGLLLWIHPDWDLFRRQVLEVGSSHYGLWAEQPAAPPVASSLRAFLFRYAYWLELSAMLVTGLWLGFKTRKASPWISRLCLAGLLCATPVLMLGWPERNQTAPLFILLAVCFWALEPACPTWFRRLLTVVLAGLALAATVKLAMLVRITVVERPYRSNAPIEQALRPVLVRSGGIAFSQRAWLSLRRITRDPARLHFMLPPDQPQAYAFRSLALRESSRLPEFDYFVVEHGRLADYAAAYPPLSAALSSGDFGELARIRGGAGPMPITGSEPYDLVVIGRK